MCELISAATMSSALGTKAAAFTVMDALMIGSTLAGGVSQYQQSRYQQEMANYNAAMQRRHADDAIARGAIEEERHRTKVRQLIGSQRANSGAMGIDMNRGTAADLQAEAAALGEEDAWTIRNNAARAAWGHQASAGTAKLESSLAARAGGSSAIGSIITAGGQVAGLGIKKKWWE